MSNILNTNNVFLTVDNQDSFVRLPDLESGQTSALQSQYAHSSQFVALSELAHEVVSLDNFQELLIKNYFDLETATGVGLDSIAKRVGVERYADLSDGTRYILSDSELRLLIKFKARANIGDGTMPSIMAGLNLLFGVGAVSIIDNGNMTVNIIVNFPLSKVQLWMLKNYGLTQRPAGVGYKIINNADGSIFGFKNQELSTFNYGVFAYKI